MLLDALLDAGIDTLKLFPFLLVTYLFMEWLEHGAGKRFEGTVAKAGRFGPVVGALLGVVPQCGFSGAAATLYAGRVITLGTLMAVFLATSDEMLPIMISEAANDPSLFGKLGLILAVKVVAGMVFGFAIDAILRKTDRLHVGLSSRCKHEGHGDNDIHELCKEEGCDCGGGEVPEPAVEERYEHGGILLPALKHSVNIAVFIFVISLVINMLVEMGLSDALAGITTVPYLSAVVAGLFGFIPNCAVSVGITELYLEGIMSGGAMISGLCVNAGIGLLVLFRTNHDFNENLKIMGVMLLLGVVIGSAVQAIGLF